MAEFCAKILVEAVQEYLLNSEKIWKRGYNPTLGKLVKDAKEKMRKQVKLYEEVKNQKELKLGK